MLSFPTLQWLKIRNQWQIMHKAFHSRLLNEQNRTSLSMFLLDQPNQLWVKLIISENTFKKWFSFSEITFPLCVCSVCVDVFIPGCPLCRAAAGVWRCVCVLSSGRGHRARSDCCLQHDAAAGSSAPQLTPCALGRHGKNWSWTRLRGEKGRWGKEKNRKRQEGERKALISTHFVLSLFKGFA